MALGPRESSHPLTGPMLCGEFLKLNMPNVEVL